MAGKRRCTDYDVLGDDSPASLADRVSKHMYGGWEPAGGIAVTVEPTDPHRVRYFQAIARYTDKDPFA